MWASSRSLTCASKPWLVALLLLSYTHISMSMPQYLELRQSSFPDLQLPQCALKCYVAVILSDGCTNETDFACHCSTGNMVDRAKSCIMQGCNNIEATDGLAKVKAACKAIIGGGNGGGGSDIAVKSSTTAVVAPTSIPRTSVPAVPSPSSSQVRVSYSRSVSTPTQSARSSGFSMVTSSMSRSTMSTSTGIPFAPLPQSNTLSEGAKAGISIGVISVALFIFLGLGWYIRRLKRDLRDAQAATNPTEDTWQPHMPSHTTTIVAPLGISRSRSWTRGRRSSRDDPVSPLSPQDMAEVTVTDNGYGVLKKKRGEVLSIVVEGSEGDGTSLIDRGAREPVAGQKEGLIAPLELDREWTGIAEMPLAVTPRNRSLDQDRDRDRGPSGSSTNVGVAVSS